MQDISLHILDIMENSARAGSKNIEIIIQCNEILDIVTFCVKDDGCGMDAETLEMAQNPFYTSKQERVKKVGLGIPLFRQNAEACNGHFRMESTPGEGTVLEACFQKSHIDRMPLGNLKDTLLGSIIGHTEIDFWLQISHIEKSGEMLKFAFDTASIKNELGDIPISYPDVITLLDEMLKNGIKNTEMEDV